MTEPVPFAAVLNFTTGMIHPRTPLGDNSNVAVVRVRNLPGPMPPEGWSPRVHAGCCEECRRFLASEQRLRDYYGRLFDVAESA